MSAMPDHSIVRLPPGVRAPFEVYVNGVPQQLGRHYEIRDGALRFNRHLAKDKISKRRWLVGAFGVGTYRQHDSVDVRYQVGERVMLAEGLEIEPG